MTSQNKKTTVRPSDTQTMPICVLQQNYAYMCPSAKAECDGSDTPCLQVYFSETTV